jgi:hypothetical protein
VVVLRRGCSFPLVGVVVGLVGAIALTRFLGALLFNVTTSDLATWVVTPLFLVLVAAWRAGFPRGARRGQIQWRHFGTNEEISNVRCDGKFTNASDLF